ncbi:hypothetical protein CEXT_732581 [Caerostris extrusa]|uniref:Uncharacterized protein n=1 Tax=Caerostris extrusa TaxID=172846 RepID=A0AAV4QXZ2_CAEEX|nr:hypothetical protein CEXT_732581 [Caerostris extrusa]
MPGEPHFVMHSLRHIYSKFGRKQFEDFAIDYNFTRFFITEGRKKDPKLKSCSSTVPLLSKEKPLQSEGVVH